MNAFYVVWRNAYVRVLVYLLLAWFVYSNLGRVGNIITLAVLAYMFAYLTNPIVEFSRRRGIPRGLGVAIVYIILILFLIAASVLIASIVAQLIEFAKQLPALATSVQTAVANQLHQWRQVQGSPAVRSLATQLTSALQTGANDLAAQLLKFLQGSGLDLISGAVGLVSNILEFALVFIVGGYTLYSYPQIGRTLLDLFPRRWQPRVLDFTQDVNTAVGGYIRGQVVIAVSIGALVALGLTIIGLPLALAIGFIAGLFNIVPYLGVIISVAPAVLLAASFGWVKILLVLVVFVAANQLEAHVFSPIILSRSTDLHPVTVILSILAGLAIYGIVGGLLAVPLAALGKLLIRKYWLKSSLHDTE